MHYDDIVLKTFIYGLSGANQNNVHLRNPDSLEKVIYVSSNRKRTCSL